MGGYKGMRTRRDLKEKQPTVSIQPQNEQEEPVDAEDEMPNLDDPEVQAATAKIQAGYKGMQTRKELKEKKHLPQKGTKEEEEEEEMPNLEDPEVQAATAKIQAGYKGMQTRKELKEKKDLEQKGDKKEEEEEEM